MRVRFAPDVLQDSGSWDTLDRIVASFLDGRHRWEIDDPESIKSTAWLLADAGGRAARRNLEALEKCYTEAIYQPSGSPAHRLLVVVTRSTYVVASVSPSGSYSTTSPRVTPSACT